MRANPSQSDANLMSIQCQSCAAQASIHYQSDVNPLQSRFQLTNPMPNLSIIRQFIANPRPIRESTTNKQPITNPPIQCRSVSANPPPIHHCQSANPTILDQSINPTPFQKYNTNPLPIPQSNANMSIQCQSADPSPIRQSSTNRPTR